MEKSTPFHGESSYAFPVETFAERFKRLTAGLTDVTLMRASGLSLAALNDIRSGRTKSLKLDAALRLCRKIRVSPWELQGVRDPAISGADEEVSLEDALAGIQDKPDQFAALLSALDPPESLTPHEDDDDEERLQRLERFAKVHHAVLSNLVQSEIEMQRLRQSLEERGVIPREENHDGP